MEIPQTLSNSESTCALPCLKYERNSDISWRHTFQKLSNSPAMEESHGKAWRIFRESSAVNSLQVGEFDIDYTLFPKFQCSIGYGSGVFRQDSIVSSPLRSTLFWFLHALHAFSHISVSFPLCFSSSSSIQIHFVFLCCELLSSLRKLMCVRRVTI